MKAEFVLSASSLILDKSKQSLTNMFQKYSLNIFCNACNEILISTTTTRTLSPTHLVNVLRETTFNYLLQAKKKKKR